MNLFLPVLLFMQSQAISPTAPLDRDILAGIEDGAPVRSADENYYEFQAYNYLLVRASKAKPTDLSRTAARDVTLAHLFEEPVKYRGSVVHVEGKLKRLRRFDASRIAQKQGIPFLYEGWIFLDDGEATPYCVVFTELPIGLVPGEKLDRRVSADAYFFKRYRYKAGDHARQAPLLLGRSLRLWDKDVVSGTPSETVLGPLAWGLASVLVLSVVGAAALYYWYRRGDKKVRDKLATSRSRKVPFNENPFSNEDPE